MEAISQIEIKQFKSKGFVCLESFMDQNDVERLCLDLESVGSGSFSMLTTIKIGSIIKLLTSKKLEAVLDGVFENKGYSLHHITSALHTKETPSLGWHHDKVTCYSNKESG